MYLYFNILLALDHSIPKTNISNYVYSNVEFTENQNKILKTNENIVYNTVTTTGKAYCSTQFAITPFP